MGILVEGAKQIVESAANSPKASVAFPIITAAIPVVTNFSEIQGYLSIVSMVIGIVISCIISSHWWIKREIAKIDLEKAKMKAEK